MVGRIFLISLLILGAGGAAIAQAPPSADKALTPAEQGQELTITIPNSGGSYMGVFLEEVTPQRMKTLGLTEERGAILMKVVKDSPAEQAGLKENDVIVSFNGQRVDSVRELQRMLGETPAHRTVTIEALRDGKKMTFNVALAKREFPVINRREPFAILDGAGGQAPEGFPPNMRDFNLGNFDNFNYYGSLLGGPRLGISAEPLTNQLAAYFGVTDGHGVLISEVMDDTPAAKAGLKAGDVIISVNNKTVQNVSDVREAIRDAARESGEGSGNGAGEGSGQGAGRGSGKDARSVRGQAVVPIRIMRNKHEMNVTITLEGAKRRDGIKGMYRLRPGTNILSFSSEA
ncbi:MAG TPA: PDZ domain-containing protein [Blastocatellia bacterium]|nr:PDZ domain-containing protein [Blastocatellia bacterium]